jgi:hypothetical protein
MEVPYFDYYLKSVGQPLPKVKLEETKDPFIARISIIAPCPLMTVQIYWARANPDVMKRKWIALSAVKTAENFYEAKLPTDAAEWFAVVSDDRPMTVSSDLVKVARPSISLEHPTPSSSPQRGNRTTTEAPL